MADKITALPAYATPDKSDVMPIVDLTTNTTKKVTVANLLNASNAIPLVYKAFLTQAAAAAPSATTIYNTVGAIVWARSGVGTYTGTLAGVFLAAKTWFSNNMDSQVTTGLDSIQINRTSDDVITITTYTGGAASDDILNKTSILIEVYP